MLLFLAVPAALSRQRHDNDRRSTGVRVPPRTPVAAKDVTILEDPPHRDHRSGRLAARIVLTRRAKAKRTGRWALCLGTLRRRRHLRAHSLRSNGQITEETGARRRSGNASVAPIGRRRHLHLLRSARCEDHGSADENGAARHILPLGEIGVRVGTCGPNGFSRNVVPRCASLRMSSRTRAETSPSTSLPAATAASFATGIPSPDHRRHGGDVASPTSRTQVYSNPGDEAVDPRTRLRLRARHGGPRTACPRSSTFRINCRRS
jgi:hypothetical protein